MNEIELLRLYQKQLAREVRNTELPAHDRNAAAAVLAASRHLIGARLRSRDEPRTWVFSDPHFEHEASVGIFDRPFRSSHHADGYLFEQWTRDVRDDDTLICLGDVTMGRPTDGLIDRLRRRPGRKILVVGNHDHAHLRRLRRAFDTDGGVRPPAGRARPALHARAPRRGARRLRQRPRPRPPESLGGRVPDQRLRGADRVPANPDGRREETRPAHGSAAARRRRHDRRLHRLGEGLS